MKKVTRRDFLRLSTTAAAGALAAACAPKTEVVPPTDTPAPKAEAPTATPKPAEPTATPTPEPVAQPWPREDVPRNRTLIREFGYSGGELANVGIAGPYCQGFSHQETHCLELEALYYYSSFADKVYPWLAESHEYNDDGTELTVHLRKGAEWSDGEPFDAEDVVFTMNMLVERAPDLRDSAAMAKWIKSCEKIDDYTVKYTFNETYWRFIIHWMTFRFDRGVYLVPEHIYKDVEEPREFTFWDVEKGWPVTTGPYQTTAFDTTHKNLDLRYDWWAAKTGLTEMPFVERVTQIPLASNENAAERIINNEIDICFMLPPSLIKTVVDQAPHVITHSGREAPYGYVDWWPTSMWFNCLEEPWDDRRVRWAVAYAVDQQQLVDVGQMNSGYVSQTPFPPYPGLMNYIEGIQDILEEYNVLQVDLEKSADLMKEAGFEKDGEGFWVKDGVRPEAKIVAAAQHFGDIAPLVAEQMIKAGFDAEHISPPDVWAQKGTTAKLHFFGHGGSIADPHYTMDFYHSRLVTPTGENCGNNRSRWGNPDYDAIVDEIASRPMDDPKNMELVHQAFEIWYHELPELPLVQFLHRIPMNTTYWTNWPTAENPYINGAPWHLTFPMMLWGSIGIRPTQ